MSNEPKYWIMPDSRGLLKIHGPRRFKWSPAYETFWTGDDYESGLDALRKLNLKRNKW